MDWGFCLTYFACQRQKNFCRLFFHFCWFFFSGNVRIPRQFITVRLRPPKPHASSSLIWNSYSLSFSVPRIWSTISCLPRSKIPLNLLSKYFCEKDHICRFSIFCCKIRPMRSKFWDTEFVTEYTIVAALLGTNDEKIFRTSKLLD